MNDGYTSEDSTATPDSSDEQTLDEEFFEPETVPFEESCSFWDQIPLAHVVMTYANTTGYIPKSYMGCIKELKGEIFVEIDKQKTAGCEQKETRAWKAVLAVDAMVFHDVKGERGNSRAQQIADRVKQCHRGQWAALWANVSIALPFEHDEDKGTELSRCARKGQDS